MHPARAELESTRADEDDFQSEATLAKVEPVEPVFAPSRPTVTTRPLFSGVADSDIADTGQTRGRGATYVLMAVLVALSGAVGFLVAEYSHRSTGAATATVGTSPRESVAPVAPAQPATSASSSPAAPAGVTPSTGASGNRRAAASEAPPSRPLPRSSAAAFQTLSGWWSVTNRIESTSHQPFDNLNLGYRLQLTQNGTQITGSGYKWMENGRQLPPSQQTTIAVDGTIDGRRVDLRFTEYGTSRTSTGHFIYDLTDTGVLQGRFSSDAAASSGSTQARRMP